MKVWNCPEAALHDPGGRWSGWRASELISPGKARSGITPLVRYSLEPLYRLLDHKVDNDHQHGTMGIHRSGGQLGRHKHQQALRAT